MIQAITSQTVDHSIAVFLVVMSGGLVSLAAHWFGWIYRAPYGIGNWVRAGILLAIIWGSVIFVCVVILKEVTIQPTTVTFLSPEPHDNYVFTVTNRTDHDLYEAVASFTVVVGNLNFHNFSDLSIDIPKGSSKPIMHGSVLADVTAANCLDSRHRAVLIVVFGRLTPNEHRELELTRNKPVPTKITAEILHFTSEQPSRRPYQSIADLGESMRCDQVMFRGAEQ